jgi:hypothetical protein
MSHQRRRHGLHTANRLAANETLSGGERTLKSAKRKIWLNRAILYTSRNICFTTHQFQFVNMSHFKLQYQSRLWYNAYMTTKDLKTLLERVQSWPEEAQDELVDVANQIESELRNREYLATQEELRIIDAATASIDRGEFATDAEIETAFGKFRPA